MMMLMMMIIIIIIIIIIVFRLSERPETLTGAACILFVTLKCRQIIYWGQSEYTAGSYNQSNLSTLQVEKWLNGITTIYNLQLIAAFSMYDMV